jgi:CRP-like cAMP-binding protein
MFASTFQFSTALLASCPAEKVSAGTLLLRRGQAADTVLYVERGRVLLGLVGVSPDAQLDHQLGSVEGPAWLEATSAVLRLPSAVDALAESEVTIRRMALAQFHAVVGEGSPELRWVLLDLARAHRQQTELAVSRLAKDAEARCAEWLLRHAQSSDKGGCSVQLQQRKRLIAAQLGIAPETLSRVLRHLRERSLISGSGRVVNLVDMRGLKSLAGV